ncbi:hypothetical protein MCAP1_000984 [Malassezia caprae]|uniref:CAP-Gly domain-containing protein n=1 Tax=Malassezia caprae TaxID=1381934 RepID=A0AAF0IVR5_9BASI|nr:hypothetical protein MCAP1_000984 [Malassezia caprae]
MPPVGTRVARRGDTATVAYVGPLPPYEGTWYGVVWDRAGRGQHDGVGPDGTRHFTCAPRQGSFLPASTRLDTGVSFVDAMTQKYGSEARARSVASLVGAPPPPALADASCVYVRCAHPDGASGPMPYARLESLDLSRSLLADWDQVAQIAASLPLHTLVLQQVRLRRTTQVPAAFAHLQCLYLNDTRTDWAQALVLGHAMPALTTLQLARNEMETLGASHDAAAAFPHLTSLHLGGNRLRSCDDIAALQPIASLRQLILSGNEFTTITPMPHPFAQLDDVQFADNPLEAASVPALESWMARPYALVLPLLKGDEKTTRLWAIAQLPRLARLHHTPITPHERTDAERYYLTVASPNEPRYQALCEVHGAPVRAAPRTLRDNMLDLCWARAAHAPTTPEVSALRAQAQRLSMLATTPVRSVQRHTT